MLTLYFQHHCQYCRKVLDFAAANHITLELRDIHADPTIKEDLIKRGGKKQVPYLVDSNKHIEMYESDDIVNYLRVNYVN